MALIKVIVDSIRQALLSHNMEYPWVIILKSKSSNDYLPICINRTQADLIQQLLFDEEPIPLELIIKELSLPVEQFLKDILESIVIESLEENKYHAKMILKRDDKAKDGTQIVLPVGNAIALSLITKVPIFINTALLMHVNESTKYDLPPKK